MDPQQALHQYFGYDSFRPLQREAVEEVLAGRDVFVLMPTGGGKSLCYSLPSVMMGGTTVVVSPLISLMKDQVDGLVANGIRAAFLNSSMRMAEQEQVRLQVAGGGLQLLYVAPERLVQASFLELLHEIKINFFAIDEAHCISQWGHDFRPEYRQLAMVRREFPGVPLMALTATATPRVKEDIVGQLGLQRAKVFQASFYRPNLFYSVQPKMQAFDFVLHYIREHPESSGIVYCQSRNTVDRVAERLQAAGVRALPYHAGLDEATRRDNQERFIRDDVEVMVATVAFGMGIDKPNVRFVIHYDLPKSLEHYYQETGRAGRDGLPSDCVLLFSYGDKMMYERFIAQMGSESEQYIARHQLQRMVDYAQSTLCRHEQLLNYFAEEYAPLHCQSCDNCVSPKEKFDGTMVAQQILSCVYRLHERFGAAHVINVLVGSSEQKLVQRGHDKLSVYGIVKDFDRQQLKMLVYELVQLGYLRQTDDQYAILGLTPQSGPLLRGKVRVALTKPAEKVERKAGAGKRKGEIAGLADGDRELFEKLRGLRKRLADEMGMPPYIVFADTSLRDMAARKPQSLGEFAGMYGVGKEKLERYGEVFVKEITNYVGVKS